MGQRVRTGNIGFVSNYIFRGISQTQNHPAIQGGFDAVVEPAAGFWPLLLAVLVGGQIGSHIGIKLFSPLLLRRMTALLVGYAAIRLMWQAL